RGVGRTPSRRGARPRRRRSRRARRRSSAAAARPAGGRPRRRPGAVEAARCAGRGRRPARARRSPTRPPRSADRSAPREHCRRRLTAVSAPGIFRPPPVANEPVRAYAPGSPERGALRERVEQMRRDRLEIPLVIGGRDVRTGRTREAVEPHRRDHVLADVHQGGADEVRQAIDAAAQAWEDWHRWPWEERAAVFLRAAELLAGPWRDTLLAATMLGQ